MAIYWERAGSDVELTNEDFRQALSVTLEKLGHRKRVLALRRIILDWTVELGI